MQFLGIFIILIGMYLIDDGIKNRAPIAFIKALLTSKNPNLKKTLAEYNGQWTDISGYTNSSYAATQATAGANAAVNVVDAGSKVNGVSTSVTNSPLNGKLPASALTPIPWAIGYQVANAAAGPLVAMNKAYMAEFGSSLKITSAYRTLASQTVLFRDEPSRAAAPGKSNHGMGLAVDFGGGINNFNSKQYAWMIANGPSFGWVHPAWAAQGGSRPEPWHFEYVGA